MIRKNTCPSSIRIKLQPQGAALKRARQKEFAKDKLADNTVTHSVTRLPDMDRKRTAHCERRLAVQQGFGKMHCRSARWGIMRYMVRGGAHNGNAIGTQLDPDRNNAACSAKSIGTLDSIANFQWDEGRHGWRLQM